MKTKFYPILLCAALCACGGGNKQQASTTDENVAEEKSAVQYPIHIPFEKGLEVEREVKLSEIADSVTYIRLETTDEGLVRGFQPSLMRCTSKYFIFGEFQNVIQFTRDGKFVRNIGRRGQGPGEYNYILQVDVDEKAGKVYVLSTGRRFNVYDLETGKYLQSVKLPNWGTSSFLMQNDSTIVSYIDNGYGQEKTKATISTLNGNILHEYPRHELFEVKGGSYRFGGPEDFFLSKYKGMINLKEYENDTVYTITPEGLQKRYIIDTGKYGIKLEHTYPALNGDEAAYNRLAAGYMRYAVLETENYLFLPYANWAGSERNRPKMAMYDKRTGECYRVKGNAVSDDLTNALYFYYPHCALDEHTLIFNHQASVIHKMAEKKPELLNHPQLKGLKEDDNPVLMIVHLKR